VTCRTLAADVYIPWQGVVFATVGGMRGAVSLVLAQTVRGELGLEPAVVVLAPALGNLGLLVTSCVMHFSTCDYMYLQHVCMQVLTLMSGRLDDGSRGEAVERKVCHDQNLSVDECVHGQFRQGAWSPQVCRFHCMKQHSCACCVLITSLAGVGHRSDGSVHGWVCDADPGHQRTPGGAADGVAGVSE
jgi:hypothetical protein